MILGEKRPKHSKISTNVYTGWIIRFVKNGLLTLLDSSDQHFETSDISQE